MLEVWNIILLIISAGIAPKQLIDDLFSSRFGLVVDFDGFFNLVQLIDRAECLAYPPMDAEDVILDDGRDGHFLKNPIAPAEERVRLIYIFFKFESAFIPESHAAIDDLIFMSASQQHNIIGIFNLQTEQK